MTHSLIKRKCGGLVTRNEQETSIGQCCLCHAPLIRVDYEWYYHDQYRYKSEPSRWIASHETNLAHEGASHCADCEAQLRKTRERFVKRQRVNFIERDGTTTTELVTRAPLHPAWNSYFKSIGMASIK